MLRTVLVVTSLLLLSTGAFSSGTVHESPLAQDRFPLAPQAGTDIANVTEPAPGAEDFVPANMATPPAKAKQEPQAPDLPTTLSIPSIHLSDPVQGVGVTADGAMDVPSGKSKNVGWYEGGTTPGETGSAVMDAHVFAAFSDLRYVKIGQSIYVTTQSGKKLRYVVTASMLYTLDSVPLNLIFNRDDGSYLNLITCAGHLTPDHSTYDHRLVVYAKLVE